MIFPHADARSEFRPMNSLEDPCNLPSLSIEARHFHFLPTFLMTMLKPRDSRDDYGVPPSPTYSRVVQAGSLASQKLRTHLSKSGIFGTVFLKDSGTAGLNLSDYDLDPAGAPLQEKPYRDLWAEDLAAARAEEVRRLGLAQ